MLSSLFVLGLCLATAAAEAYAPGYSYGSFGIPFRTALDALNVPQAAPVVSSYHLAPYHPLRFGHFGFYPQFFPQPARLVVQAPSVVEVAHEPVNEISASAINLIVPGVAQPVLADAAPAEEVVDATADVVEADETPRPSVPQGFYKIRNIIPLFESDLRTPGSGIRYVTPGEVEIAPASSEDDDAVIVPSFRSLPFAASPIVLKNE